MNDELPGLVVEEGVETIPCLWKRLDAAIVSARLAMQAVERDGCWDHFDNIEDPLKEGVERPDFEDAYRTCRDIRIHMENEAQEAKGSRYYDGICTSISVVRPLEAWLQTCASIYATIRDREHAEVTQLIKEARR